jgi:hypothetical protein
MIAGIILHPVRILVAHYYRNTYQNVIRRNIAERWHWKNYDRMHHMSEVTGTAYTKSDLYGKLMEETCIY